MSEEEKAIKWLEKKIKDYSLNSEELHYLTIIYNLVKRNTGSLNNIILNQQKRIDKTIQAIDEILIYNDLSDTTSAFGNAPRELKQRI